MAGGSKMAWSKSTRIKVMIVIDTAFFLLELIVGFLAHSLALTADAFHMVRFVFLVHWNLSSNNIPSSTTSSLWLSAYGLSWQLRKRPRTSLPLA